MQYLISRQDAIEKEAARVISNWTPKLIEEIKNDLASWEEIK